MISVFEAAKVGISIELQKKSLLSDKISTFVCDEETFSIDIVGCLGLFCLS